MCGRTVRISADRTLTPHTPDTVECKSPLQLQTRSQRSIFLPVSPKQAWLSSCPVDAHRSRARTAPPTMRVNSTLSRSLSIGLRNLYSRLLAPQSI